MADGMKKNLPAGINKTPPLPPPIHNESKVSSLPYSPGWNDPPNIPMCTSTSQPRRNLNRRVPFPLTSKSSNPAPENIDEAADEIIKNLNESLINIVGSEEVLKSIGSIKDHWSDENCTKAIKLDLLKFSRHIHAKELTQANMLALQIKMNPNIDWCNNLIKNILEILK